MDQEKPRMLTRPQNIGVGVAILFVALTAGLYLGQAGTSSLATLPGDDQLAAVAASSGGIFQCAGDEFAIDSTNDINNPVIVPVVNNDRCSPSLPAYLNFGQSLDLYAGGVIPIAGSFDGSNGTEYTMEAVEHSSLLRNAEYPRGYYKFYFQDPSSPGDASSASGSMNLRVLYHFLPQISINPRSVAAQMTVPYDMNNQGGLMYRPVVSDVYYLDATSGKPLSIDFKYSAYGFGGNLRVRELIWNQSAQIVSQKIVTVSSNQLQAVSYSPNVTPNRGQAYFASICPLKNDGITVDGRCKILSFSVITTPFPFTAQIGQKSGLSPKGISGVPSLGGRCTSNTITISPKRVDEHIPNPGAENDTCGGGLNLPPGGTGPRNHPVYLGVICYEGGGPTWWNCDDPIRCPGQDMTTVNAMGAALPTSKIIRGADGKVKEYLLQRTFEGVENSLGQDVQVKAVFPKKGGPHVTINAEVRYFTNPDTGQQGHADLSKLVIKTQGVATGRNYCKREETVAMNQSASISLIVVDSQGKPGLVKRFALPVTSAVMPRVVNVANSLTGGRVASDIVASFTSQHAPAPGQEGLYNFVNDGKTEGLLSPVHIIPSE